jgi:hypothetical protein
MHDNDQKTGESRAHVLESVVRKSGSWMTENPEVILGAGFPGAIFLGLGGSIPVNAAHVRSDERHRRVRHHEWNATSQE